MFFLALSLATCVAYALLVWLGFPGAPSSCLTQGGCWCEEPTQGWAREPFNTWSNIFVFCCCLWVARHIPSAKWARPSYDRRFLLAFGYALWVQAGGALFFHGTLTEWSRALDTSTVLMVHGVIVTTSLIRLRILKETFLVPGVLVSTCFAVVYSGLLRLPLDPVGLASLLTTLFIELRLYKQAARPRLLHVALVGLVLSMTFWATTHPGGILCDVLPGHALWHIGMGITVACFGLHAAAHQEKLAGAGERGATRPWPL